jgi:hypothetical protein
MKLRIKGNSIRIRLTKTEVSAIATKGYIEEHTHFGLTTLTYALSKVDDLDQLSASYIDNTITMLVPGSLVKDWPDNDVISFDARIPMGDNGSLYLLLEKDFVCLDHTTGDQSDNYPNPNKTC